jgi:transglutaminase-like putative cysteine protease
VGQEVFSGGVSARRGFERLNRAIYEKFRYEPGSTDNSTPLETVWKQRAGVCQDFTHDAGCASCGRDTRSICLRLHRVRSDKAAGRRPRLVGSLATHAWVETLTPGMRWLAIDPTNNQWCGQRHVTIAYGRDSVDATPLRGTFRGSGDQLMKVRVLMKRMSDKP